jgi:hypothetical protein
MRVYRMLGRLAAGVILVLAAGTTVQAKKIDPEEFRVRLMSWAVESEKTFGTGYDLANKLGALSEEQVKMFMSAIEDPEAFLAAIDRAAHQLAVQSAGKGRTQAGRQDAPLRSAPPSPANLTSPTPFPPDYPPDSGSYKAVIIDGITFFGIPASSTDRCGTTEWAKYVAVWFPLWKAIDTLDGACVVAGCDPTGVVCAIACGVLETAKVALKVAAVPLQLCDVHEGAINGAEIEATHENVLTLLRTVELRRVHLQVIELAERKQYLVVTTVAGKPVDVEFLAIQAFDDRSDSFVDISSASVTTVEPGNYVVQLNLAPHGPDKIFRFQVKHDDDVDQFGEAVFHRTASRGIATGQ